MLLLIAIKLCSLSDILRSQESKAETECIVEESHSLMTDPMVLLTGVAVLLANTTIGLAEVPIESRFGSLLFSAFSFVLCI